MKFLEYLVHLMCQIYEYLILNLKIDAVRFRFLIYLCYLFYSTVLDFVW